MSKTIVIIVLIVATATWSFKTKNDGLEGRTGSPNETTCNTTNCHTGNTVNAVGGSIVINAPTLINNQYFPGATYPIQVTVSRTNVTKYGFGFEALRSTGANGGTITVTNAVTTQIKTAVVVGNARTNIVHRNGAGIGTGSFTFSFNWTAPATNVGNITFYAAGNASNAGNNSSGDYIYTTTKVLTPSLVGITENNLNLSGITVFSNPVTENLKFKFDMDKSAHVVIELLNLTGQKVQLILDSNLNQGTHNFDEPFSDDIQNGVYLLQISTNGQSNSKRVVVIR
jgi:hypothetical protein